MDNIIVNNETGLLCYRLRTERQRKRAAKKDFEKRLRALDRERRELWEKRRNLGWVELKPPVMRGWNRFFVLREDVARSRHAGFFQGILDKINTVQWCNRKDFRRIKRKDRKRGLVEKGQELRHLQDWEMVKLGFTEGELSFFEERRKYDYARRCVRTWYVFTEPWRFVRRVEPNIITKARIRDEEIEKRLKEIENVIAYNHLAPAISKVKGDSYNARWWKDDVIEQEVYQYKNMPLLQILDAIKEEQV